MGHGLRYVYTGNVHDGAGGSTYCHGCGALLIGRDWYELTGWGLDARGCCRACGTRRRACSRRSQAIGDASGSRCDFSSGLRHV